MMCFYDCIWAWSPVPDLFFYFVPSTRSKHVIVTVVPCTVPFLLLLILILILIP